MIGCRASLSLLFIPTSVPTASAIAAEIQIAGMISLNEATMFSSILYRNSHSAWTISFAGGKKNGFASLLDVTNTYAPTIKAMIRKVIQYLRKKPSILFIRVP